MVFLGIILLVQSVALLITLLSVKRLYAYIHKYRFDESVYTLLFGFMRLRYFVVSYLLIVALTVCVQIAFGLLFFLN